MALSRPKPERNEDPRRAEIAQGGATEIAMVSLYVLCLIVILLVIYLFYAVINPQKF